MLEPFDYTTCQLLSKHALAAGFSVDPEDEFIVLTKLKEVHKFESVEEALGFCRGYRHHRGDFNDELKVKVTNVLSTSLNRDVPAKGHTVQFPGE